ncbi:hypothetical protein [Paraburkholderia sp. A3RO-2L]
MYLAAKAAKVPIDIRNATIRDGWDAFVIGEQLQSDYDAFIQANGTGMRAITDCLIDILAWRYEYRHAYDTLPFVQSAGCADQNDLLGAHKIFLKNIGENGSATTQADNAQNEACSRKPSLRSRLFGKNGSKPARTPLSQDMPIPPKERREILDRIMQRRPGEDELKLFSTYCHDSYAGFKPFTSKAAAPLRNAPWESGGYLQYRTRYAGESLRLAMLESLQQEEAIASSA